MATSYRIGRYGSKNHILSLSQPKGTITVTKGNLQCGGCCNAYIISQTSQNRRSMFDLKHHHEEHRNHHEESPDHPEDPAPPLLRLKGSVQAFFVFRNVFWLIESERIKSSSRRSSQNARGAAAFAGHLLNVPFNFTKIPNAA